MQQLLGPRYVGTQTPFSLVHATNKRPKVRKKKTPTGGFTPYEEATMPPPGKFDPALEATLRGAQRGYGDLQQDTELASTRRAADYGIATGEIRRQFDSLGRQQLGAAGGAGLLNSGWRPQAYKIRSDNMARAIAPLTLQNTRSATDAATNLSRAGRELGFFTSDTRQSEIYQAKAAGWKAPKAGKRPKNERAFRGHAARILSGNKLLLPSGKTVSRGTFRSRYGAGVSPAEWERIYKAHPWLRPIGG